MNLLPFLNLLCSVPFSCSQRAACRRLAPGTGGQSSSYWHLSSRRFGEALLRTLSPEWRWRPCAETLPGAWAQHLSPAAGNSAPSPRRVCSSPAHSLSRSTWGTRERGASGACAECALEPAGSCFCSKKKAFLGSWTEFGPVFGLKNTR